MSQNMPKDVVADKQIEVINEVQKTRARIERAIEQSGPFTHNMIGLSLASLAKKVGTKYANELVDEFDLTEVYGIERQPE